MERCPIEDGGDDDVSEAAFSASGSCRALPCGLKKERKVKKYLN